MHKSQTISSNHLTILSTSTIDREDKLLFYIIPFQVLGGILRIQNKVGPWLGMLLEVIRAVGGALVLVLVMGATEP